MPEGGRAPGAGRAVWGPRAAAGGHKRGANERRAETGRGAMGGGSGRARRIAYEVLAAVSERDAYANLLLASALRDRGLRGQDAALATELTYVTLRTRACYDAIIGMCADRDLGKIDTPVLDVLRLGAHQLLGMR